MEKADEDFEEEGVEVASEFLRIIFANDESMHADAMPNTEEGEEASLLVLLCEEGDEASSWAFAMKAALDRERLRGGGHIKSSMSSSSSFKLLLLPES